MLPQSPRNLGEQQRARTTTLNNANVSTDQTERNTTPLPQGNFEMSDRDGSLAEAAQGKSRLVSGFNLKLTFSQIQRMLKNRAHISRSSTSTTCFHYLKIAPLYH